MADATGRGGRQRHVADVVGSGGAHPLDTHNIQSVAMARESRRRARERARRKSDTGHVDSSFT